MSDNRTRKIVLRVPVTDEENHFIRKRMETMKTSNLGAYMRKMAIDGEMKVIDMTAFKEVNQKIGKIGVNINQIAKRLNETNHIYAEDIKELKERLEQIWQLQRCILSNLP